MFSQEVISTDKFSVNHFLHNEVKNTDISSCIAHLARGLQSKVPFAEGVGGGFEASAGEVQEEQGREGVPHGEHY